VSIAAPQARRRLDRETEMDDELLEKPPVLPRGRAFEKGRSGNPAGRRPGSRNKATLAAAALLAGEAEGLTRKAVEAAFAGDPMALRLCVERLLPVCRERPVKFALPPIESAADIAAAMKAVTSALADGEITPGEAGRIADIVDTFVRAIETSGFERRLQELEDKLKAPTAAGTTATGSGWNYNRW
jgi:hypothetical protein